MIAMDLTKQQALNVDPTAIQQITFTRNLEQQARTIFITEEAKKAVLHFSQ